MMSMYVSICVRRLISDIRRPTILTAFVDGDSKQQHAGFMQFVTS